MKRKVIKLFLLFPVIVLSLLFSTSCNETAPENPPEEIQEKDVYRKEIKDSEYIEFVLNNFDVDANYCYWGPQTTHFFFIYKQFSENGYKVKEYKTTSSTRIISGYIPREWVETIFETDAELYLQALNSRSMYRVLDYLKNNNLKYSDIGFKLYYVHERFAPASFGNEFLVYMGEEGLLSDNDGNFIKIIGDIKDFKVKQNEKIEYTNLQYYFFQKYQRFFEIAIDEKFIDSFDGCEIYTENGIDIVKENESYLKQVRGGDEFKETFSSAEIYVETRINENGDSYISNRVYDYEKVKEILGIK